MGYKLLSHPIKLVAAYIFSPILMVKLVVRSSNNPVRRGIAIFGLILALIGSYIAGTLLGGFLGFILIATNVGVLTAIGFIFGTTMSFILSTAFSLIVFNFIAFVFLKISKQEVIDYLSELIE